MILLFLTGLSCVDAHFGYVLSTMSLFWFIVLTEESSASVHNMQVITFAKQS